MKFKSRRGVLTNKSVRRQPAGRCTDHVLDHVVRIQGDVRCSQPLSLNKAKRWELLEELNKPEQTDAVIEKCAQLEYVPLRNGSCLLVCRKYNRGWHNRGDPVEVAVKVNLGALHNDCRLADTMESYTIALPMPDRRQALIQKKLGDRSQWSWTECSVFAGAKPLKSRGKRKGTSRNKSNSRIVDGLTDHSL